MIYIIRMNKRKRYALPAVGLEGQSILCLEYLLLALDRSFLFTGDRIVSSYTF